MLAAAVAAAAAARCCGIDVRRPVAGIPVPDECIGAPGDVAWEAWLVNITAWRASTVAAYNLTGAIFDVPALRWTQRSYIQPQMHPYDRYFWDPAARAYTVDRYVDDTVARYGGIDSALIWPTYPCIGMDDRNQFDMIEALPGCARAPPPRPPAHTLRPRTRPQGLPGHHRVHRTAARGRRARALAVRARASARACGSQRSRARDCGRQVQSVGHGHAAVRNE